MRRRTILGIVLAAGLLLALGLLAGPPGQLGPSLDPSSTGPTGTRALVDVARELGAQVTVAAGLDAETDVLLILRDGTSETEQSRVLDWVADGGRLVVTDPTSRLHGLEVAGGLATDVLGPVGFAAGCPDLPDVETVVGATWTVYETPENATGCVAVGATGDWLVRQPMGAGEIVALGGADPWTNSRLAEADNAVLAVRLLDAREGVHLRIAPLPTPGSGDASLMDLVPTRVWHLLALALVAFVLVAIHRGRRLGAPVAEPLPLRVPAAELVRALGDLHHRAGDHRAAAGAVRDRLNADLRRLVAASPDLDDEALADLAAERLDLDSGSLRAALCGPLPEDATALLAGVRRCMDLQRATRTHLHQPDPRSRT